MKEFKRDKLNVKIYKDRDEMGNAAARDIAAAIEEMSKSKDELNVIFAAAPSQNEVLRALKDDKSIKWERINAYHMDEYVGLTPDAPQGFGNFLRDRLFSLVPLKSVNYIDASASSPDGEAERYGALIDKNKPDIVVMGIGENGHIAFNDPGVADFNDKRTAKPVALDDICRTQQVNDGCFEKLSDVPTSAITLTVPTLFCAEKLFCVVPAPTKARAVARTLNGAISESCPATILRRHACASLYLEPESAKLL